MSVKRKKSELDSDFRHNEEQSTLRMTRIELSHLESQLNAQSTQYSVGNLKRRYARYPYWGNPIMIEMSQPSGSPTRLLYTARDISPGGIGVLHLAYTHLGTRCVVHLPKLNGSIDQILGTVVLCTHLQGTVHQIGLKFDHDIEVGEYVLLSDSDMRRFEQIKHSELWGRILYAEAMASDRRIFEHFLKETRLEITHADNAEQFLEKAADGFTAIVLDYHLADQDAPKLIVAARERGALCPLIVISADDSAAKRSAAHGAGAATFLTKPLSANTLINALAEFTMVGPDGNKALSSDTASCRLSPDDPLRELVPDYLSDLQTMAKAIEQATGDAKAIANLCMRIAGSAQPMGFPSITKLAGSARQMIVTGVTEDAERIVDQLVQACKRARCD